MKILQLVTKRQYRGAEVFAANLSEQLIHHGHEIVFVGLYPAPVEDKLCVEGALNLDLDGTKKFFSFSLLNKLKDVIKLYRPDIIQANGSDTLKYAVAAKAFGTAHTPLLYRNISMISSWIGGSFLKRKFYQFLFSRIDFVTSVGTASLNDLIACLNFPPAKTKVIRRGIPIARVDKALARRRLSEMLGISDDTGILVHAGNYSVEKNHKFLIDVSVELKRQARKFVLVLLGEGNEYTHIDLYIRKKNVREVVHQLGFKKDINMFLAGADLFVLSSRVEGVPGVILEAAAQATPSVSVNVGGVKEVIQSGVTGFVVDNFDVMTFSARIGNLLDDPHTRQHMGQNAFAFVKEHFDADMNARSFLEIYQQLLTQAKV